MITTSAHILAPASSPSHPVSMAQYATETWSKGGVLVGLVILALVLAVAVALAKRATRRSGVTSK